MNQVLRDIIWSQLEYLVPDFFLEDQAPILAQYGEVVVRNYLCCTARKVFLAF